MVYSDFPLILCVDDNPEALTLHQLTLKLAGFPVTTGCGCLRALTTARKTRPAVIMLNLHCRDRDSCEVIRQLKEDRVAGHIPIILFSFGFVDDRVVSGLNEGADGYISRPASNLPRLAEMIKSHLPEGVFI